MDIFTLGSVINEIDNLESYDEYAAYGCLPHIAGVNYKGIEEVHKFMMDSIIGSSICIAFIRTGKILLKSLEETVIPDDEYLDIRRIRLFNTIERFEATLKGFKDDLCNYERHHLYNHDTLIKILDINDIAYFTQTVRNNDKNHIDRNIIINVGENNILELNESLSEDNVYKLVDIDLKLINYDNHLKSQSNNEYFSEIEIHEGVPF